MRVVIVFVVVVVVVVTMVLLPLCESASSCCMANTATPSNPIFTNTIGLIIHTVLHELGTHSFLVRLSKSANHAIGHHSERHGCFQVFGSLV